MAFVLTEDDYRIIEHPGPHYCTGCGKKEDYLELKYSMECMAGRWHQECWEKSSMFENRNKKFDPSAAGETLDEEESIL